MEEEAEAILGKLKSGETTINDLLGPLYGYGKSPEIVLPRGTKAEPCVGPEYPLEPQSSEVIKKTVREIGPDHFPELAPKYDVIAIGAGVAGLLSVIIGKSLGKQCLLVEKHYMGGDCLNVGCFPSKALIACARKAYELKHAADFGIKVGSIEIDFPFVMNRMRELRASIAPHDGVARYERDFTKVVIAQATFLDASTLQVESKGRTQTVRFDKCFVCTGASASVVPVPGLRDTPHLTNANFFNLQELPPRACLIGAGPIGIEMAQALQRFGSQVTIFEISSHLLPREDSDAAEIVAQALVDDGVDVHYSVKLTNVKVAGDLAYKAPWPLYEVSAVLKDGTEKIFECEVLLNATGRTPNVHGLGLDEAGVDYDTRSGIHIDDYFKTTNPNIYAAGDVCSPYKFTHAADFMGRLAVRNAFLDAKSKHSSLLIPWCTYTDPEIAHVGLYEQEMDNKGIPYDTYLRKLADVDRCKCEGVTTGFVKISCEKDSPKILGATIVGPNAGDLISEISVAMQNNLGVLHIAGVQHPYPTTAEAIRQCAAQYNPKLRTPALNLALKTLMS